MIEKIEMAKCEASGLLKKNKILFEVSLLILCLRKYLFAEQHQCVKFIEIFMFDRSNDCRIFYICHIMKLTMLKMYFSASAGPDS